MSIVQKYLKISNFTNNLRLNFTNILITRRYDHTPSNRDKFTHDLFIDRIAAEYATVHDNSEKPEYNLKHTNLRENGAPLKEIYKENVVSSSHYCNQQRSMLPVWTSVSKWRRYARIVIPHNRGHPSYKAYVNEVSSHDDSTTFRDDEFDYDYIKSLNGDWTGVLASRFLSDNENDNEKKYSTIPRTTNPIESHAATITQPNYETNFRKTSTSKKMARAYHTPRVQPHPLNHPLEKRKVVKKLLVNGKEREKTIQTKPSSLAPLPQLLELLESRVKTEYEATKHTVETMNVDTSFLVTQKLADLAETHYDLGTDKKLFAKSTMTTDQERVYSIRSQIILELLGSEEKLEDVLAQRLPEIDTGVIDMLNRRSTTAKWTGDDEAAHSIELLSKRVKAELVRAACSPNLQLLDECLKILAPGVKPIGNKNTEVTELDLYNQVTCLLSSAFGNPRLSSDIITMSMALCKQSKLMPKKRADFFGASTADPITKSYVEKDSFLKETSLFYNETLSIRTWEVDYHLNVERIAKIEILRDENRVRAERLAASMINKRYVLNQQMRVLAFVAQIIKLAKNI